MEMKYGFVEFYDKDDKVYDSFFKTANNRDILGLRKMNIRMSNILFPFGNTLMPNLEYFYYLNAIYHVLKGNGTTEPPKKDINKWETIISQYIVSFLKSSSYKNKGFFGDTRARAYPLYKTNMTRMHFLDAMWVSHSNFVETALSKLKKTKRYQFVEQLIKNPRLEIGNKENDDIIRGILKNIEGIDDDQFDSPNYDWLYKLEDIERLDFIRRVVLPYPLIGNPKKLHYSVFSNIVCYYCMLEIKPSFDSRGKGNTIYNDEWCSNYIKSKTQPRAQSRYDFSELEEFDDLNKYFAHIPKEIDSSHDYKVAITYSKLQRVAKIAYLACFYENNEKHSKIYEEQLKAEISDLKNRMDDSNKSEWFLNSLKNKNMQDRLLFIGIKPGDESVDPVLEGAFKFVSDIARIIKGNETDSALYQLKELIRKREKQIMGDDRILGSGLQTEPPMTPYIDTFRWQYRPEYQYDDIEDGEIEVENSIEQKEKVPDIDNKLRTSCASYYIHELFFEPYQ